MSIIIRNVKKKIHIIYINKYKLTSNIIILNLNEKNKNTAKVNINSNFGRK